MISTTLYGRNVTEIKEAMQWCKENIGEYPTTWTRSAIAPSVIRRSYVGSVYDCVFNFNSKEDAVMFSLRWG